MVNLKNNSKVKVPAVFQKTISNYANNANYITPLLHENIFSAELIKYGHCNLDRNLSYEYKFNFVQLRQSGIPKHVDQESLYNQVELYD